MTKEKIKAFFDRYWMDFAVGIVCLAILSVITSCSSFPFLGGGGSAVPAKPPAGTPEGVLSEGIGLAKTTIYAIVILAILLPSPIERLLNGIFSRFKKK
tara:strand:- start:4824 stop:5120 length:297 start_codon:yes stop_codon:yes gene_type:complete